MKWANVRGTTRILGACTVAALCAFVWMSTEMKKDPCSLLVWSGVPSLPGAARWLPATAGWVPSAAGSPAKFVRVQDDESQAPGTDAEGGLITPCLQDVKAANFRRWAVLVGFCVLFPVTLISLYSDHVRVKRRTVRQKERDERWRRREARLNAEAAQLGEDH